MALADDMPNAEEALATAIADGHLEENPENKAEVRITALGLARYMVLQPAAEAMLQADPTDESPVDPPDEKLADDGTPYFEGAAAEEEAEVDPEEAPLPVEPPQ